MTIPRNAVSTVALAALLGGCSLAQKQEIDARGATLDEANAARMNSVSPEPRPVMERVRGAWLAPRAVSLGEDAALPAEFSNERQWPFGAAWTSPRADLRTIAERISKITGLPVRMNPDVYETGMGGARAPSGIAAQAETAPAPTSGGFPPAPPRPGLSVSPSLVKASSTTMEMNFTGTLAEFLNRTAMHFGINWEYKGGAIHFYRYVTKLFRVNANPGDTQFTSSLGKSSSGTGQGNTGSTGSAATISGNAGSFASTGQTAMTAKFDVWDSLSKQLDSVRTPSGKVTISQATGTVLMVDTRDAVESAERIIKHENRMLTQQVAVRVDIFSVTSSDNRELGVDWNVVFQKLSNYSLSLSTPTSLVSAEAGSLGAAILSPGNGGTTSKFSGSEALLRALQGVGRVTAVNTASTVTLNRNLGTLASTDQVTYLATTTPGYGAVPGGGSGLPGLTPGTVTTGIIANALPTVLEDGSVMLTLSLNNSLLKDIGVISVGSGATLQQIQTPEVNDFSTIPRVLLKPGATLVMSGLSRDSQQYTERTLAGKIGLGGSYNGRREKVTIVIMVSAQLLSGA
ncbi:secretin N-terminal domain-containing protein [Paracidovorax citrulli]